jgi:small GTP-binding protein
MLLWIFYIKTVRSPHRILEQVHGSFFICPCSFSLQERNTDLGELVCVFCSRCMTFFLKKTWCVFTEQMEGMDNAGKTTILYKLFTGEEIVTTIPTIGFNVETGVIGGVHVDAKDTSSYDFEAKLTRKYYAGVHGVIFVVDSCNMEYMDTACMALKRTMAAEELRGVPMLVFANKQDLPRALSAVELTRQLCLTKTDDRKWFVQGACALTGAGLHEGLKWLSEAMESVRNGTG